MRNQNIYKLDANTLKLFLKVCELQSISRAAEHFDLNQSTVSNTMERLKLTLGYKLFEKAGRNIVPTENALALVPRATRIISAIEGLPETGKYAPNDDGRPITIVSNLNTMLTDLVAIRDAIWAKNPERMVRMLELGSRDQLEKILSSGAADFAVTLRTPKYPPQLSFRPLFLDHSKIFYDPAVRSAPETSEDYFAARHGVLDFGGLVRSSLDTEIRRQEGHRVISCAAGNASALASLIKGTDMICALPGRLHKDTFSDLAIADLPFDSPPLRFDLVWHKSQSDSSRHQWYLDLISSVNFD